MAYEDAIIASVSSIISVILGIFIGNGIAERKEKLRELNEVKKIQSLLNSDFTTVKRLAEEQLEKIKKLFSEVKQILDSKESPIEKQNKFFLEPFVYFPFWQTLTNSGSLLKLKPYEIKAVSAVHDKILDIHSTQLDNFEKYKKSNNDPKFREDPLNFLKYAKSLSNFYEVILLAVKELNDIEWITLKGEYGRERKVSIEKSDKILVKDGITYYPDGTKVDSHGTIL